MTVGICSTVAGLLYLFSTSSPAWFKWSLGAVLMTAGAALVIGILTPLAGLLVSVCFLGIDLSSFPSPFWGLHDTKLVAFGMVIMATSVILLGPGAFSLDGYLFGRREIVIPPSSRDPEP